MATTTATPSRTTSTARAFPLKYFVIAFAFTWTLWWLAALEARGLISPLSIPAQGLGVLGPLVAAVVLTAREGGAALAAKPDRALACGAGMVRGRPLGTGATLPDHAGA